MQNILLIVQVVLSLVLIFFILIQNKGTGFGRVWGTSSSFTRRGLEKLIFRLTFSLTDFFVILSLINTTFS